MILMVSARRNHIKNTKSLNVKYLEYLTFPDTRWTYLAQVSKRHIQVLPVLVATYEDLAFEDPTIIGRLRQLRDVKLLYTIIVISDIFTEMAAQIILKHQSPDSVICELKQDVQNTIAFFGALKSTYGTAEKKFWSDLKIDVLEDENTLNFSMCLEGGRVMKLEFKDRSQRTQIMNSKDIKQTLLSIK